MAKLCCPTCAKTFVRPKNRTHLVSSKREFTCCSKSCGASFGHAIRKYGKEAYQSKIDSCLISVYKDCPVCPLVPSVKDRFQGTIPYKELAILWSTVLRKKRKRAAKPTTVKLCVQCGKKFTSAFTRSSYCSYTCANIGSRKVRRPSKKDLTALVWEIPTVQLAKRLGVSDTAIAKWCKYYNISKPPRGYWARNPLES